MKQEKVRGDRTTFVTLLSGLLETDDDGCLTDACNVVLDTFSEGIILEKDVYEGILMKIVEKQNHVSLGASILRNAKSRGVYLSS